MPKELVRRGLDDGTERLRSQLRDTAQHGQRDDYGGYWIEDTASAGGRRAEQTAEKLLKRKRHGSTDSQRVNSSEERPVPKPPAETDPQEAPARSPRTEEQPKIKTKEAIAQKDASLGKQEVQTTQDTGKAMRGHFPAVRQLDQAALQQRQNAPSNQADLNTIRGKEEFVQEQGRSMAIKQAEKQRLQATLAKKSRVVQDAFTHPAYTDPGRGGHVVTTTSRRHGTLSARTVREEGRRAGSAMKTARAGAKTVGRASQRTVKTAGHTAQKAVKTIGRTVQTAQKAAVVTAKASQRAAQAARVTARAAVVTAKAAAKAAVAAGKAAVAGIKSLAAAIAAGGWVAVVIVILICLIGLLVASPFGIFFAEDEAASGSVTPSAAVVQINGELTDHLNSLWMAGVYDNMEVLGQPPAWPDVMAVFAAKTAGAGNGMPVAVLDPQRVDLLRTVFWDMTKITTEEKEVEHPAVGNTPAWMETVLSITVTPRTPDDMRVFYAFTEQQNTALDEILASEAMLVSLARDLTITNQEAKALLASLPDDLSLERRAVVETTCRLVGKVNYFWGGKSLILGWDDRWGSLQKVWAEGNPTTGTWRPYGLDCSGMVDWTFYNASGGEYIIGHGGGAMMQHRYCMDIGWDEAQPGDLVFYPADEHVGIVGGRDESGNLLVIHCASSHNNVVITGAGGFVAVARPDFYDE